jgi:hypothetical protein
MILIKKHVKTTLLMFTVVSIIKSGVPADLDPPQNGPPGPNPLANMDRGVHIH